MWGLRATGSLIALDQSKWFLVDFKWSLEDMTGEITLLNRNGARIPLEHLDISKAEESMGVWITMDDSQDI